MSRNQNVTMIEDLPDLDELDDRHVTFAPSGARGQEQFHNGRHPDDDGKYKRAIREDHMPLRGSGMGGNEHYAPQHPPHPPHPPPRPPPQPQPQYVQPPPEEKPIEYFHGSPSCIDVAYHIRECPICSQFYKNDKAPYMITIIILAIICILLLKKVMNV